MYRYETHVHTSESSACGKASGAEHARFYKSKGYQGIIVTDHFFGGNTAAPRTGKWEDRVNAFCRGYEQAKAEGDHIGLDVFFGWEETIDGDDYLVYGLDKEWLLAHPEADHWDRKQQFEQVTMAGGCVIQAHPFRCRDYMHRVYLNLNLVHAVEIANACNHPVEDAYAKRYADTFGMYGWCGSDNHRVADDVVLYGVGFEKRIEHIEEVVQTVRNRQPVTLLVNDSTRFCFPQDITLPLPCSMVNSQNEVQPFDPYKFVEETGR